ncbi:MAG: SIMPL domain-containing protein [Halarchaeum sp.]
MRRNIALAVTAVVVVAGIAAAGGLADVPPGSRAETGDAAVGAAPNGTTIDVSASGSASAEPDQAVLSVAVVATADSADAARERVAANASTLREALRDAGVPADAIETTSYRVNERQVKPAMPVETGAGGGSTGSASSESVYEAVHAFQITVDDPERAGAVLDAAVGGGANRVQGVRYTLSEETQSELRTEAIHAAMTDAHARASAVADASGVSVTGLEHASVGYSGMPVAYATAASGGDAATETVIDQGPVTVTVSVQATYVAE